MKILRDFANCRRFGQLPRKRRQIVFFSEGKADWPHLAPLLDELESVGQEVAYLASASDDPGLARSSGLVSAFEIGSGFARTILFRSIEADIVVMTMPDLDVFHLKKSVHPVNYVYVFHALNSAHMIYPAHSFDAYDTVFCAGPHHVRELRELERLNELPPRNLVEYGYGRIDELLKQPAPSGRARDERDPARVLVAPTWGPEGIVEQCGHALIRHLLEAGLAVVLRPHPMSWSQSAAKLGRIEADFSRHPLFSIDRNIAARDSLDTSDVMVTDWSGVAYEYAFALGKPVLFVDLPPKIRNPDYRTVPLVPFEVAVRDEIGQVLSPERLHEIGACIAELLKQWPSRQRQVMSLRETSVFNLGNSSKTGAKILLEMLSARAG
jgi:YidC/Oxa1 family membrane protein insertase